MTNESNGPQNRRRSRRVNAHIRILFTRAGASVAIQAETDDISLEGVFVRTKRRPPDVGTKLGLLLKLDEPTPELMLSGVVAWVREGDESSSPGMGIHFVDVDEDQRTILRQVLEGTGEYQAAQEADFDN